MATYVLVHGAWHGAYSAFMRWREKIAEALTRHQVSPGLADRWRAVAKSYRTLARQHTEMKYRRQPMRVPKIEDRNT